MSLFRWITIIALAACAKPNSPAAPLTKTLPEPVAPASGLKLAEITVAYGGEVALKIHADGAIEARESDGSWKAVGKLSADGKFLVSDGSTGELEADGTFKTPQGPAPFKLDGDALVGGDKHITIDANGSLVGAESGSDKIKITGATDTGTKRTALLILGLLLSGGSDSTSTSSSK